MIYTAHIDEHKNSIGRRPVNSAQVIIIFALRSGAITSLLTSRNATAPYAIRRSHIYYLIFFLVFQILRYLNFKMILDSAFIQSTSTNKLLFLLLSFVLVS
jgi:hypothetical protein